MDNILLPNQQPKVQIPAFSKIFKGNFEVADVGRRLAAKNSGQRLDNVNQTHLVLASGKLILQKTYKVGGAAQRSSRVLANDRPATGLSAFLNFFQRK